MNDRATDPFLVKAQERLVTLAKEQAQLAAQEEGVRKRRLEKQAEFATVKQSIALYHELMDTQTEVSPSPGQLAVPLQPSATVADLVFAWVSDHGGRGRVKAILQGLVQAGKFNDDSNGNYSTVYTALMRDPRFEKVDRGEFGLRPVPPIPSGDSSEIVDLHELGQLVPSGSGSGDEWFGSPTG
jgi:hypothetical protein